MNSIYYLKIVFISIFIVSSAYSRSQVRRAGDVLQIALPATALCMTYAYDDIDGRNSFYKAFATTSVATLILKRITNKTRPDGSDNYSFPSGHTSAAFSGASFIFKRYGLKYGLPSYLAAAFVGYSRVYSKKHYWEDVVAGASLAILNTYLFSKSLKNGSGEFDAYIDTSEIKINFIIPL